MIMMTFRDYINTTTGYVKPSVQQTFLNDARNDANLPDVASWEQLRDYLVSRNAGREAFTGAKKVWDNYYWVMVSNYIEFVENSRGFSK
jgi:hypothetical protein